MQQSRFSDDGAFLCAVTTSVPATTQLCVILAGFNA